MRANFTGRAAARVAAGLTIAIIALTSGSVTALHYRTPANVRGHMAPASADHPAGIHLRVGHVRTTSSPALIGGGGGGPVRYR
jgi:hypothetical protein